MAPQVKKHSSVQSKHFEDHHDHHAVHPDTFLPVSPSCFERGSAEGYASSASSSQQGDEWSEAELLKAIPGECVAEPTWAEAGTQLASVGVATVASALLLSALPWYALPAGWAAVGFAACALHTLGLDAERGVFSPSAALNRVVASVAWTPLLAPSNGGNTELLGLTSSVFAFLVWKVAGFGGLFRLWLTPLLSFVVFRTVFENVKASAPETRIRSRSVRKTIRARLPVVLERVGGSINVTLPDKVAARVPSRHARRAADAISAAHPGKAPVLKLFSVQTLLELSVRPNAVPRADNEDFGAPPTVMSFFRRIYWMHVFILFTTPALAFYGIHTVGVPDAKTVVWALVYYVLTGFGITVGYHRLWSHRAFDAAMSVQYALVALASGSVQGSAKWWCRNHRAHHRYTDTPQDPYSAKGGFWYAHIGWMMVHADMELSGHADVTDLKQNSALRWQHKWYLPLIFVMAVALPTCVPGLLWGDWAGGFFYAAMMRLVFVHHSTFCVNSVAHYFGDHTFDDERTPRDHMVTALLTLGEGYHNFHHEFPNDYRNGIRWFDYDPTKWCIAALAHYGLAWNLQEFPDNEIRKGRVHMQQKKIDAVKKDIVWPVDETELPTVTMADVRKRCEAGEVLLVVNGLVHDVKEFMPRHPGGVGIVKAYIGQDATEAFTGKVYKHSRAARNLLSNFRIARIAKHD